MKVPRFGAQRLVRPDAAERWLFRLMGVADPAHYLHWRYLRESLDRAGDLTPSRILDAGCGAGDHTFYLAQRFPDSEVIGVDVDAARIARNQETAPRLGLRNVSFEVQDLTQLPWVERFDLVISIDVLEHIVEQQTALRCLQRVLRPGGRFFFHIPTKRRRPVPFSAWLGGFHAWAEKEHVAEDRTAEGFVAVVRAAGFEITDSWRTFGFFTGELATSLFALPYDPTPRNKVFQVMLAPVCRALAVADLLQVDRERYAVAVTGRRPRNDEQRPLPSGDNRGA
jgi:SAM-dependent methyltransferase